MQYMTALGVGIDSEECKMMSFLEFVLEYAFVVSYIKWPWNAEGANIKSLFFSSAALPSVSPCIKSSVHWIIKTSRWPWPTFLYGCRPTILLRLWDSVLWTVETKLELFGLMDQRYVWRKNNDPYMVKNPLPTVSVLLWDVPLPQVQKALACRRKKNLGNSGEERDALSEKVMSGSIFLQVRQQQQ